VIIKASKHELFRISNLHEGYERHVIKLTLATLEEFQERDKMGVVAKSRSYGVNRKPKREQIQSYVCRILCEITTRHNEEISV